MPSWSGSRGYTLESALETRRVFAIYGGFILSVFGLLAVTYSLFLTVAMFVSNGFDLPAAGTMSPVVMVPLAIGALAALLVLQPLYYGLVLHRLLGAICATLSVVGEADPATIKQSLRDVPSRGEGLAGVLDIGGI